MANDDDYDFSGISHPGPFDIETSVLSQWRSQNEEEEDDDYSYFWPDQLPYDIDEKLREINKVHQEDETPIESDRPRKLRFNNRVQMRAISMRHIPPPTENNDDDEPFDLSKYDTDEEVADVVTSILAPREPTKVPASPESSARPLPIPAASFPRNPAAASQQKQRFSNKAAVSRVGQGVSRSTAGASTSGVTAKSGITDPARRGFSDSQNFQLPDQLAEDRLSVLSLTDEDDGDGGLAPVSSDTGYSSAAPADGQSQLRPRPQLQPQPELKQQRVQNTGPASVCAPTTSPVTVPVAVSSPKSAPVVIPVSVSAQKPVPVTAPTSVSAPGSLSARVPAPASSSVSAPASAAMAVRSSETQTDHGPVSVSASGSIDHGLPETIRKTWPQVDTSMESYRPTWSERQNGSPTSNKVNVAETIGSGVANQGMDPSGKLGGSVEPNGREHADTAKQCACQSKCGEQCRCQGDWTVPACGDDAGISKDRISSPKSEDSAVESMDDPINSNSAESSTDGSVGNAPEHTLSAPDEPYAVQHVPRQGIKLDLQRHKEPDMPKMQSSTSEAACQSLSLPASVVRPTPTRRPISSHGSPAARHRSTSDHRAASAVKRGDGGSPERVGPRPSSAPVRNAVSAASVPRRQPSSQRVSHQTAGQSAGAIPPSLRRRAKSQDPSLTFQQWLEKHEKQRAQAIQDKKNSAKKRKQEANVKQEKAPQAFRVWLRKKRQQQLMEQRVQQLRQHELVAAAAAPGRQQQEAFREWLARKQRERAAAACGPAQATLRSLATLYSGGQPRPPSAPHHRPRNTAAAADRHTAHAQIHHIYGPHVSRGHRSRSAHVRGS